MQSVIRRSALSACWLLVANLAWAASPIGNVEQLGQRLEQLRSDVKIPAFSAAIAQGDRIVWAQGFGLADVKREIRATPTTGYHLASLTKTFAATVIMQLVEAGKIDINAPVSQYGVDLPGEIHVRHLFNHTSNGTPGTAFSYDGNRFAMLTQVVETASGESFGRLLCRQIIEPLGLRQTAPNVQDAENFKLTGLDRAAFEANLARPYQLTTDGRFELIEYPKHFSCSAGLISTALDVARYSIALDQGKLLKKESLVQAMSKSVAASGRRLPYGLGWFVLEHKQNTLVWHYGLWIGNSSLIIKVPERKLTYVVLANSERLTSSYLHGRGELLTSPFARAFVEAFVTGDAQLPAESVSP